MTKIELINKVAAEAGITKKDADKVVNVFIDTIVDTLKGGDKVSIVGFGTFEVRARAARKGRNPRTNAPMTVPATKVPAFKAGKVFKDAVAK